MSPGSAAVSAGERVRARSGDVGEHDRAVGDVHSPLQARRWHTHAGVRSVIETFFSDGNAACPDLGTLGA